ncbi:hypothetical protein KM043_005611 [Ampulex compressa]|nr:hypothetical protein KM043_005611 [Ampulex compressa]
MSLFPAYINNEHESASCSKSDNISEDSTLPNWLTNSSFHANIPPRHLVIDFSSDSSVNEFPNDDVDGNVLSRAVSPLPVKSKAVQRRESRHVKKRKRDKKKHYHKEKADYPKEVKNVYYEDKYRDRGNSTVNTLCSRVTATYNIMTRPLGFVPSKRKLKKEIYERYYVRNIDASEKSRKKDTIIKRNSTKNTVTEEEEMTTTWHKNMLEEQTTKTREFNEKLMEEPNNIDLWLKYIEFQDTLNSFQKFHSVRDNQRATTLKKLSIIEKALEQNVDCIKLLELKLYFMSELSPADEFSKQLESMVNKDSGNMFLWQTYIMVTQASVAMCTVPRVMDLYSKCFCVLKQRSRTNSRIYDERLLQMLHWYLIFLRHAGLWEQMWETIRLNLTLNLSFDRNSLSFQGSIDEKKLIGMEEVILLSRLPLNQLWQRTESLRENCHWMSVSRDELELVGDSRRFVLPEDVADFVHPILSRNSNFQLSIYCLLSLKVPLLPCRDYMLKDLKLTECEWGVETSEILLPFVYPSVAQMAGKKKRRELLRGILEGHLTSGPQYLMFHPAQESYLDFIREVFRVIAENLPSSQRTSIYVWWLRFERLLVFLNRDESLKYDNKGKKLKNILKEFLKKEENRNNLHFYREYALIEREMGRYDSCVNILETAIQSQGTCPSLISNLEEKAALVSLYRTIIETLLDSEMYKEDHKQRILNVIEQIASGSELEQLLPVEEYLQNCVKSYLQEVPSEEEMDLFFLPNLKCDTIICYAYFIYTRDSNICKANQVLMQCIDHYKECPYIQEILYESQLAILELHHEHTQDTYNLKNTLTNMLNVYPNNFYALSVLASIESELPTWKFNTAIEKPHLWKAIAMCLAGRRRVYYLCKSNDTATTNAALNKLISFHKTLARLPRIKHCPLLWRLYMLLLREHNLCEKKGEEVYHESVAQSPWARSIYIDAAEVAPQLLTQIQDVIREKELRMHVTPEELDILRG